MMSENQTVTNFELLPNEILFECFRYLNALQIFHSFDQLNSRFHELIRRAPLYVDFQDFPQPICVRFCEEMLRDSQVKKNVYSLNLSNKDASIWIRFFFRMFSLLDFLHLRSLTLTNVNPTNEEKLAAMLPSKPLLRCFRLNDTERKLGNTIATSIRSVIRILTLPQLPGNLTSFARLSSLTSFTMDICNKHQLLRVLNDLSTLKYLQINYLSGDRKQSDEENLQFTHSLQHLVVNKTDYRINDIEMIIKHTPNLNRFTLFVNFHEYSVRAQEWERLLQTYLRFLKVFKFCFQYFHEGDSRYVEEILQTFQTSFWRSEHDWIAEYALSSNTALVYTVPYEFSTFTLHSRMKRYCHTTRDDRNTFSNVTNLTIVTDSIERDDRHSFSYNRSRRWSYDRENMPGLLTTNNIHSMIGKFSQVKHLDVLHVHRLERPSVLLEILRETRQLSSLTISLHMLLSLWNDNELCQDLNRMIHKLCIEGLLYRSKDNDILEKFCEVFANVQQLKCTVGQRDHALFVVTHLSKLVRADFTLTECNQSSVVSWLEHDIRRSLMDVHVDVENISSSQTTMWINRMVTDN